MGFRNDISFLRAFSVLVVMLFHFEVPFFDGGFIGVDIFFVISGFLMTQIILNGIQKGTFSLRQFYIRRINRIMPALCVMLAFVLLISIFFFLKWDIKLNSKYAFLSNFFVSNIYYWRYTDYFTSHDNILLHTWSLGVEWQFYMIYPLLILLLRNVYLRTENVFWGLLIGITVVSFILMVTITHIDNNFAFYMLPTRFWELSIGGVAVFLSPKIQITKPMKSILVLSSLIGILCSTLCFSSSFLWPSWYTIIPTSATVIILALNYDLLIFRAAPVKFFGDISYSLYLWHWPWFVFLQYFGFIGGIYSVILIVLSILSAFLSYSLIENNKRIAHLKFITPFSLLITIIGSALFFKPNVVNALSIYQSKKFEIGNYENVWLETGKEKQFNPCNCFETVKDYNFDKCLTIDGKKKNVLLIGDSHAAQFSSSLRANESFNLLEASVGFAFPFIDTRGKPESKPVMDYVFNKFIPKYHDRIDLVIISAHWLMGKNPNLNYKPDEIVSEIRKSLKFLEQNGIKYIIIGQSETYKLSYPRILMTKYLGRKESDFFNQEAYDLNERLKAKIDASSYIDIYNTPLINKYDSVNMVPYMFDANHFSKYGADQVMEKILSKRIEEKLKL